MKRVGLILLAGAAVGGVVYGTVTAASEGSPERPDVVVDDQTIEFFDGLPDRVAVLDRRGNPVGTVAKRDIDPRSSASIDEAPDEVLDDEGRLVGHMWPGIGFVSLAEAADPAFDPEALRQSAPTTTVAEPTPQPTP